ncbi:MAG: efflux RND transporter periplasmic adaptor subunit [Thermoanaerobaculia bacterium]|nr:efflux RND transporter periplasmic adaptor subunit [Thermoanaerobaculia bacterium]
MLNLFSTDRIRTALPASLLLLGALAWTGCGSDTEPAAPVERGEIQTTRIELTTIPDHYEVLGTIRSTTRSTVASKLMGTVVSVPVEEGEQVRQGDLLVTIDSSEVDARIRKAQAGLDEIEQAIRGAEAALASADANLNLARATYGRFETLRDRGSVSPQEFEEVEARFKAAAAGREQAARQLEALRSRRQQALADLSTARTYGTWARVTSPLDGVVTATYVDPGDLASPGVPLVAIDDPSSYRLDVQIDESRLSSISVGDPVTVRIESLGTVAKGVVQAIAPAVDPSSRTALVKIALPDAVGVQSGMFARAHFNVGERRTIVVPTSLIVERGQLEGLYVLDDSGEPRFRLIKTGPELDGRTEVLSGISVGDLVVAEELHLTPENQPIEGNRGRTDV